MLLPTASSDDGPIRDRVIDPMDEEELTDAQIEALTARLEALRDALGAALDQSKEGTAVVSLDQPIGRVSRIDALQQQKLAQASRRQQELELGQVRVALAAARSGDYGFCRSCEEPIGFRRLSARPQSPFCLRCQSGRER